MAKKANKNLHLPVPKLETGINGFDDISSGGLPKGRPTLVSGTSGSCKTIMAIQYVVIGIKQYNENGVFVTFEETPADIKRNVKSFGWDLQAFEDQKKLAFVDASPEPGYQISESGEYDFSAFLARIEHAVNKVNAKRVGIDSIGALFSQFTDSGIVRRELFRIAVGLKQMKVTSLITTERTEEYGSIARFGVEEFVADNVIVLRNILEEEKRRRTIKILKFRGAPHQKGEYPFTVSNKGIEVLPLSSMLLTMESSDIRIGSGNKELDKMCNGGFYRDSIILISGATGTGKTLLATTYVADGCRKKTKSLIFAFEESRSQLLRNAIAWNMDFRSWEEEGLLKIICSYPESIGLADHLLSMKNEIEAFQPDRIAVDSLSALERVSAVKGFREFVIGITSFIKEKQISGMFTAVTPSLMGGASVTEQHISTITDSIILMRYVELMGEMRRGLAVLKMRGSYHEKAIREYIIDSKGLHIGRAFHNVGGILAGTPTPTIVGEQEKMGEMFGRDV